MTTPQPRPKITATGHGAPNAMCTANDADRTASPPVLSRTPPSATYRARAVGTASRRSGRAPASRASPSPIRRSRAVITALPPGDGDGDSTVASPTYRPIPSIKGSRHQELPGAVEGLLRTV